MLVIGHRGCKYAKENTIDAFKCAIDDGVDMIELDIQYTKDMEIIVFHDINCERLTPFKGLIKNKKFTELKKYGVPLLEEVLNFIYLKKSSVKIYIEFKGHYNDIFLKKVINLLKKHNKQEFYLASFNYNYFTNLLDTIKILKKKEQYNYNFKIGYITSNNYKLIHRIEEANFISINHEQINEDIVTYFKKFELNIYTYTVNRKSILNNVLKYNIDGIISDIPCHIINWIQKAPTN